jgi:hypothetical protein
MREAMNFDRCARCHRWLSESQCEDGDELCPRCERNTPEPEDEPERNPQVHPEINRILNAHLFKSES